MHSPVFQRQTQNPLKTLTNAEGFRELDRRSILRFLWVLRLRLFDDESPEPNKSLIVAGFV
jgi:hypothetical protein